MTNPADKDRRRWTLADQVAFECALAHDEREEWRALAERDRAIARSIPEADWRSGDRRAIARTWLAARLGQAPSIQLAADCALQSIQTSGQLLCIVGAVFGLAAATAALAYTGSEPINVSAFFGVFVLLQALMALALFVPFLLPAAARERLTSGLLFRFARAAFGFALAKTQVLASRFLEAQHRADAAEIAGIARARLVLHRGLFKWLAFAKLQSAALCFNCGALAALLVAVAFSDRAFGWQTTLDVSSESVHAVARGFAAPWAWLHGEGEGYPTLAQIEGSRIVLKDGIRALRTESLVAWWPFLALGILAYGLAPRLAFRILAGLQMRRALRGYDFGDAAAQRLFDRLSPPAPRFEVEPSEGAPDEPESRAPAPLAAASARQSVGFLVERGIAGSLDLDALGAALAGRWRLPGSSVRVVAFDAGSIAAAVAEIDPESQYALAVEAWMPPIRETARQIQALRAAIDARSLVRIVPLGPPEAADGGFSLSPDQAYLESWDAFVRRLGDPYLILDRSAS